MVVESYVKSLRNASKLNMITRTTQNRAGAFTPIKQPR